MLLTPRNRFFIAGILCVFVLIIQSFAQPPGDEPKPTNLKILRKNITHDELIATMKGYSKSLGVHCHKKTGEGDQAKMDFASDEKNEKLIARKMMKMTMAINKKYISKINDGHLERITCVTCHMGSTKPIVNIDSLKSH
jgi:hypothetical protein